MIAPEPLDGAWHWVRFESLDGLTDWTPAQRQRNHWNSVSFSGIPLAEVTVGPALTCAAPPPSVPDGFKLVPVDFLRGFCTLAHNYSLKASAPEYYHGVERDAFSAAYARCGSDLAKLRAMLAPSPDQPV